jgi:phosphate starvation-inducible PhoH-like protein
MRPSAFAMDPIFSHHLNLTPEDTQRLAYLCGPFDEHLRQIEQRLGVEISNRGHQFRITGTPATVDRATKLLQHLYKLSAHTTLDAQQVHLQLQESNLERLNTMKQIEPHTVEIKVNRGTVNAKGTNQALYLHAIATNDINFGIGPAGTGKTYLAVAMAVDALQESRVQRIILTRPAVEAGEHLGFLPGDLSQKVDPYLRPLYDALYEMLGFDKMTKLMERNVIEVAPLAFMRGRTLNDSFVILDEAQNTSLEQMKMFLTRIGFGSVCVVNGDLTQIDLPKSQVSGLAHAIEVLKEVSGISFTHFTAKDVVRHPLVQRIVQAYEAHERTRQEKPRERSAK